ncbi:extracellular solute-binding protein [Catenulispora pinisilvae]|uniref:extracellular solute-binding protein n=1 Tax=Catenulispora pinisilvae TaxID=2705253 RepID=UPI001890CEB7|nr:extracellular solute-binding protein [Catenulispora pinisilvae]
MKRNASRTMVALVTAAGIAMAGAACSSSSSKGSSTKGSTNSADGVADGKPLDPNATVTISIDGAPGADQAVNKSAYADDLAAFKILYPNVTVDAKPYVGQVEVAAQFTAQLKAHNETGAFHAYFTDKNQVLDSNDETDISSYINDQTVPGWSQLLPGVKQNLQDSGKTYSLPINYYSEGLIYNRDLFTKAGLDPNKPPTTWDEVEADAAKISALGGGVSGYEDYSGGNNGGWHFAAELDSNGGQMVNADGTKAAFNTSQGQQVLQRLHDMRFKDGGIGPTPVTQWADAFPPLATSKVGMFIGAPDVIQHLVEVLGASPNLYGMGPMPGTTGPATGTLAGGDLYYFKKGLTPNQIKAEIAWIDFEYLTPGKGQFDFARDKALATPDKPVAIGLPQKFFWNQTSPQMAQVQSDLKTSATLPIDQYTDFVDNPISPVLEPPAAQQLYKVLDTAMSAAVTDANADPAKLLSTAETQVNQILANQ